MDPFSPQDNVEHDECISGLVNEFFDRRRAGEDLTPERFAAEHPELSDELRPYLAGLALVNKVCTPDGDTVTGAALSAATEVPAVEGYEIMEEIGRGGMGVVYKALQVSTKRIVALKVMLASPFASGSARRRFQREVELAARLRHSNIVSVLEGGHVADQPYYAMDYVAGIRLKRYLSTRQPDLHTTLGMFERICEAVDYAHNHGVIHRDLKPANVLVDDEGEPHVLDFGLAKATDQSGVEQALTPVVLRRGFVLGTLSYLSPEQAVGVPDEIDLRTDVYALGVMLFEALTGSLPFDMTGWPAEVIERMLETPPIAPSSLSKCVDGELEAIILKALEKDRVRRYQSAREMADDIHRYLEGEPIHARQPDRLYVFRKKLRKHRRRVALGVATVVLSLSGLLAGIWWREHLRERELVRARRAAMRVQQGLESQRPNHQFGAAHALFERHPELAEAALVQARALHGRSEGPYVGIGFLEGVLRRDPTRWACRALLAEFCRAAGDAELAEVLQTRAEREAPDTAEAWYLRSFATLNRQRALQCAQEAVKRDPSHVLGWERLTWLRLDNGDLDGAIRGAERLIGFGEDMRDWTIFKGNVLARQGHFRRAIAEYTRVHSYDKLAHAYRRIKEYDKAVECYDRVLEELGKKTAAVWHFYQRATPLWILGRTEEALADYEQFRSLYGQPWYSDARRFLILCELGRQREAQQVLAAALRDAEVVALRDLQVAWLCQVLRCLAGRITPDELVADGVARNNREQLCEAYYYAGEVCLLAGNRDEAHQWFELCVQTGLDFDPDAGLGTPMNEFELAQWRLETLFADTRPAARP